MENHKATRLISTFRLQAFSFFNRFNSAIQSVLSVLSGNQRQYIFVRSEYTTEQHMHTRKQRALLHLLHHGKQYHHADLILNDTEDWELDYDSLNPSNLIKNNPHIWTAGK
jgi:hypothetical protein